MIHKNKSIKGKRRITFEIFAPGAKKVSLVGDFNEWCPDKHPMKKNKKGQWAKTVYLPTNTYEYKYCVDGDWLIDDRNANRCPNIHGTLNNIIKISPK